MSRRTLRLATAASILALTGLGLAPAAFAAPVPGPEVIAGPAAANPALVNPAAKTTLTITKYSGVTVDQSTCAANGTTLPASCFPAGTHTPLAGVTFKIAQVTGVDLTTTAGWTAASSYYGSTTAPAATGTPVTGVTDAAGNITFNNLPVGLYYVQETATTNATGGGTTMAAPFYVTLPMTDPSALNSWMYNVHVYPKNQQDRITVTVKDLGVVTAESGITYGAAGSHAIEYTLTSSITDTSATDPVPLGQYVITDQLDPALTFVSASLKLSDGTPIPTTAYTVTNVGGLVTITFTPSGLTLLEANRGLDVVTTLNTTIGAENSLGDITNSAGFVPNATWAAQNPSGTITSDSVQTKFGDVSISKVDAKTATTMLAGAEFAIYKDDPAVAGTCTTAEMIAANLVGGVVTTDASGAATFKGLQTSDFYNGASQTVLTTYCLVETKAPAGYNLNAEATAFTVLDAGTALAVTNVTIQNAKKNLDNNLPLTGGEGVAALSIGGIALMGSGIAYYVVAARRRREA